VLDSLCSDLNRLQASENIRQPRVRSTQQQNQVYQMQGRFGVREEGARAFSCVENVRRSNCLTEAKVRVR